MAKQRTEDAPPAALWKDTFSDLMNLLLCFFVLMFAMSTVDSQKFEEIAEFVRSWHPAKTVSNEDKLAGYSLFKQATIGDCNIPAPSMFNFTVRENNGL